VHCAAFLQKAAKKKDSIFAFDKPLLPSPAREGFRSFLLLIGNQEASQKDF